MMKIKKMKSDDNIGANKMSQIQERLSENKMPLVIALIQWFVTTIL